MKQATRKQMMEHWSVQIDRRLREACFILLCSLAIYLLMALFTYHEADPAWSHTEMSPEIHNAAGRAGAVIADIVFSLTGYFAYGFVPILFASAWFMVRQNDQDRSGASRYLTALRWIGLMIAVLSGCTLLDLIWYDADSIALPMGAGGLLGSAVNGFLAEYASRQGAGLLLLAWFLIGIHLFTGFSWIACLEAIGVWSFKGAKHLNRNGVWERLLERAQQMKQMPLSGLKSISLPVLWKSKTAIATTATDLDDTAAPGLEEEIPEALDNPFNEPPSSRLSTSRKTSRRDPQPSAEQRESAIGRALRAVQRRETVPEAAAEESPIEHAPAMLSLGHAVTRSAKSESSSDLADQEPLDHEPPSLSLLEMSDKSPTKGYSAAQLQALSRLVETRLSEFGVDVKVVGVQPGPVVTRFELDLAAGIKVNKITSLAKDLARSLSVISVRVVEVIPGKSVVGLEIPNTHREMVRLKAVLEDSAYQQSTSPLTLALGKDISGRPMVVDLAKMPHLLVAGTTGSGKSVGLNAMLLSILYKSTPEQVRLIMIDPKMLELAVYDHIPHLLTPVVTDMKDAANALRWCVGEMERRYQLMASLGVRNLAGYNQRIESAIQQGKPLLDPYWDPKSGEKPQPLETLPFIVVVVDEFADMMMVVGKKVEELIARIAQKARAAGIHLILATQRPSVDVITGLIKANIPTRIAFQVSSRIDSRTILDQSGAEQLLGHGDMLYLPPGSGVPHRIHGAFVSDEEVHNVTQALRKSGHPHYIENVVESASHSAFQELEGEADELYDQAVAIVLEAKKASISLVQRRLKIGYNRAARLVEQMESAGLVSAVQSNGLREVLVPSSHD